MAFDPAISHVGLVYSETGSRVVYDSAQVGAAVRAAGRRHILDTASAFGALSSDVDTQPKLDVAIFTSGKWLEGMPGLGFAVARIDRLIASRGNASRWAFDFADIDAHTLRPNGAGSFRFMPPAQVLAAFHAALDSFDAEGGGGPPRALSRQR